MRSVLVFGLAAALCACGRIGFDVYNDSATTTGDSTMTGDGLGGGDTGAPACVFATTALCVDMVLQVGIGSIGDVPGNLEDYGDGTTAFCGGQGGGDFGLQIDAQATATYRFTITASFTPVLYGPYLNTTCTGTPGNCQGAAGSLGFTMSTGTSRVIVVDSNGACGTFNIHYEQM